MSSLLSAIIIVIANIFMTLSLMLVMALMIVPLMLMMLLMLIMMMTMKLCVSAYRLWHLHVLLDGAQLLLESAFCYAVPKGLPEKGTRWINPPVLQGSPVFKKLLPQISSRSNKPSLVSQSNRVKELMSQVHYQLSLKFTTKPGEWSCRSCSFSQWTVTIQLCSHDGGLS